MIDAPFPLILAGPAPDEDLVDCLTLPVKSWSGGNIELFSGSKANKGGGGSNAGYFEVMSCLNK